MYFNWFWWKLARLGIITSSTFLGVGVQITFKVQVAQGLYILDVILLLYMVLELILIFFICSSLKV
jgi:hypothetical protein